MTGAGVRPPAVAGRFYPETQEALLEEVKRHVETGLQREKVIGVVAPHAGFMYSGGVAGAVYSRIDIPESVILIGPNHTGLGQSVSVMAHGAWSTPLGEVAVDEPLARALLSALPEAREDEAAHRMEHCLETQLPFLQFFRKEFRIVPVVLMRRTLEQCRALGHAIARAIHETGRDTLLVASSDMTHYESHQSACRKDQKAIGRMVDLDAAGLDSVVHENRITMCGVNPATAMLYAAQELGARQCELVRYMTSGEVSGDMDQVVGYAGLIVK